MIKKIPDTFARHVGFDRGFAKLYNSRHLAPCELMTVRPICIRHHDIVDEPCRGLSRRGSQDPASSLNEFSRIPTARQEMRLSSVRDIDALIECAHGHNGWN